MKTYYYLDSDLILYCFKFALKEKTIPPLIVCDGIRDNIGLISHLHLITIQNDIMKAIWEGKVSPIDSLTWDKLYDDCETQLMNRRRD